MSAEFELIARHFTRPVRRARLGVGDDAALLALAPGCEQAVSVDLLVCGTHFLPDTDPVRLGHKCLAVNLSDMAAMGARPVAATLALALPAVDDGWLGRFASGFFALADAYQVELIGGDTTRGPLAICVQILGEVEAGQALRRDAAQPGDDVWVSGTLGDAALGLALLQGRVRLPAADAAHCIGRLEAPQPRVALGRALIGIAHAAIDVSDGFCADLGHILERSRCAARIEAGALPRSAVLQAVAARPATRALAEQAVHGGGDDYELVFTAPAACRDAVLEAAQRAATPVARVGRIESGAGLRLVGADGAPVEPVAGFDHFR